MQHLRARWIALLVFAALAVGAFVFRAPLGRASVAALLDMATGSRVSFGALAIHGDGLQIDGLHVERRGDPFLDARRIAVAYDLRDLFPGGTRRFGLRSVELDAPVLWLVRHADGSFPFGGGGGGGGGGASGGAGPPWIVSGSIRDGRVEVLDPYRHDPAARHLTLGAIGARFAIDSATRSTYSANATFAGAQLRAAGTVDALRRYAMHRFRAGPIPIATVLNYVINYPTAHVSAGELRDLDVRLYGFGTSLGEHVVGSARLDGGAIGIPGLRLPLRDIAGNFALFDGGVASARIDATEAGLPLVASGGIYDWSAPSFRLALHAGGPLAQLRSVFNFSRHLPLTGTVAVGGLVEGAVGEPLVIVGVTSPRVAYGAFPIDSADGLLAYFNSSLALIRANARYGPVDAAVWGGVEFGDKAESQLAVSGRAAPGTLPFVAQAVPGVGVHATAVLAGSDLAIEARGVVDGESDGQSLRGLFRVDRQGDGEFGPIAVRQTGGSAAGAFYLDRIASQSGFWLDAADFDVRRAPLDPQLPGLPRLAPPDFAGRVSADIAGEGHPSNFRLAGNATARGLSAGNFALGDVSGTVAGTPDAVRLPSVAASGPWGGFAGTGAYGDGRLALAGRYRGSFERLAEFTGQLGASGPLDAPVAVLLSGSETVVQTTGPGVAGVVRGVPVEGARGTLAISDGKLRIYSASARVAGGEFAGAGSVGGAARLGVALAGVDAARLRAAGSPLDSGRVVAIGTVGRDGNAPLFDGALALAGARYGKFALEGRSAVDLDGENLALHGGRGSVDETYGGFDGRVMGLGGGNAARLDLGVSAHDAAVAPLARIALPARRDIVGTADADLRIQGTTAAPSVAGRVDLPEGSVQGQAFRDASAQIAIGRRGLAASDGTITVGSTQAFFSGAYRRGHQSARLDAAQANLADFDDLFDTGDTLDGRGRIAANFSRQLGSLDTAADVAFSGLRYLHFTLGDSAAHWSSRGREVSGNIAFAAPSGRLDAAGTVLLASRAPLRQLLFRSRFSGTAALRGLDLGTWLPLLGYELPLTGKVDGDATFTGSLNQPKVNATAQLADGTFGKIPIQHLTLSASADLTTFTIASAALDLGTLQATAAGTIGIGGRAPLALSIHANSSDLAGLATDLTGARIAVTGSGEADVKIGGILAKPDVAGGFYVTGATLQQVAIPEALGQFRLTGRDVELQSAELKLAKGSLQLAGSVPFSFSPFAFGPPEAPVELELTAADIDLTDFATLLPKDSELAGMLQGRVAVDGTVAAPKVAGNLTLSGGAFKTPFEAEPLSKIGGALSFSGQGATLETFHAEGGGGTLDANGRIRFGTIPTYHFDAKAKALHLDVPAYGRGTVDGTLSLVRDDPAVAPLLSGKLSLQDTVIPFSALSVAGGSGDSSAVPGFSGPTGPAGPAGAVATAAPRPALALALDIAADKNVRVRSGNVDIGGTGALHVGGTLNDPSLAGELDSAGGTLSYFNTVFRVQSGTVTFVPDLGLVPNLKAVATTHVSNPDPDQFRNTTGSADITIDVSGPVTNLNIKLSSTPAYDQQQILGLLLNAPSLGANLFDTNANGLPAGSVNRSPNGEVTVGQQAFAIANAQFTKNLLAPFETQAAGFLGLSTVNVNVGYSGTVGLTARKVLGKQVNAVYSQTFGYPTRQSFGFEIKPNPNVAAQLTFFNTIGAQNIFIATPAISLGTSYNRVTAAQPIGGTTGVSFALQLLLP